MAAEAEVKGDTNWLPNKRRSIDEYCIASQLSDRFSQFGDQYRIYSSVILRPSLIVDPPTFFQSAMGQAIFSILLEIYRIEIKN